MFNGPGALAPGKTVSIQTNLKVAQDEPFSVDRMHISAGAANLPLANLIGPDVAGGRGWFSANLTGIGPDLNYGEQAGLNLRNARCINILRHGNNIDTFFRTIDLLRSLRNLFKNKVFIFLKICH